MDTTANTIQQFEALLSQAPDTVKTNAYRFGRNSLVSAIAYMKYCKVGERYRVSFLREGFNRGYWQSPTG